MDETEQARLAARAKAEVDAQAYKQEREAKKAKAKVHLGEALSDALRTLRRAQRRGDDRDRIEEDLKAARLALKAAEDAVRRMGWS